LATAKQTLLDDAQFSLEEWMGTEVADEFSKQEDTAFVAGDGVNKPRGFLTYVPGGVNAAVHPAGSLTVVPMGHATNIVADTLISFSAGLPAPYRQNGSWLMNSQTAAKIATLKDGQGNYLWRAAFLIGQPATLLGFPVEIDENMPNVAADAYPIAFGDFARGYLINDRMGVRVLRDPYTNKPFVHFYTTKRVGGGVLDPNAIRVLKMAAS
jgi:HK97 family phage major capsid protein